MNDDTGGFLSVGVPALARRRALRLDRGVMLGVAEAEVERERDAGRDAGGVADCAPLLNELGGGPVDRRPRVGAGADDNDERDVCVDSERLRVWPLSSAGGGDLKADGGPPVTPPLARSVALRFRRGGWAGVCVLATEMDSRRLWPGTPSNVELLVVLLPSEVDGRGVNLGLGSSG